MNTLITKIFWRRTYLFIEYESDDEVQLSLVRQVGKKKKEVFQSHLLETKAIGERKYRAKINIAIAEGRELLKPGKWMVVLDGDVSKIPKISDDILLTIEDYSRVFRYSQNANAYVVTFHITETEPIMLSLYANYMITNNHPEKNTLSDAWHRPQKKLRFLAILFGKKILNLYYQICTRVTLKRGKRILFMSQNMDHIRDNMEAIDIRLKERKLDSNYKITYDFVNIFDGKKRLWYWPKILFRIARSDYIFVDDYVPVFSFLKLNKKTVVTQLWHAGFGFKLVGYGRFGINGSPHPYESCHRKYTYGVIGNDFLKEIYSEVWGIEKESILATGMPRLDHFLDEDHIKSVKAEFYQKYPQLQGRKIITFAPTYRGNNQAEAYYDYGKIDFDALYQFCKKNNYAVAFGKHHFILQDIPIKEEYHDLIYDMSSYKLNDLFYVTDILITDYSSSFYDFLLLKRPVLFYVFDKNLYSATRGVHRPIDSVAPGKVCMTFQELMDSLEKEDYGQKEKANFLTDKCVSNQKMASDQVIDFVLLGKKN